MIWGEQKEIQLHQIIFPLVLLLCCVLYIVAKLYLTLCSPIDYSPPVSSVQGIAHTRILEWVAISFSRESSPMRDQSCIASGFFTTEPPGKPMLVLLRILKLLCYCHSLCRAIKRWMLFKSDWCLKPLSVINTLVRHSLFLSVSRCMCEKVLCSVELEGAVLPGSPRCLLTRTPTMFAPGQEPWATPSGWPITVRVMMQVCPKRWHVLSNQESPVSPADHTQSQVLPSQSHLFPSRSQVQTCSVV